MTSRGTPEQRAEYNRRYYERHREEHLARVAQRRAEQQEALRILILAYLTKHPCVECGEKDPVVLEFDHRDRAEKVAAVSYLVRQGCSIEKVQAEIAKCDVRCANCHRRRHAREVGWRHRVIG